MHQKLSTITTQFARVIDSFPEIILAERDNPVLRQHAHSVSIEEGKMIAARLADVLTRYRRVTGIGRGLAAPQIGESKAVFVTYMNDEVSTYINPQIIRTSKTTNFYYEQCLSSGLITAEVERPKWIMLAWTDTIGNHCQKKFYGFEARLLQHEEAHLRGMLNVDAAVPGSVVFATFNPLSETLRLVPYSKQTVK